MSYLADKWSKCTPQHVLISVLGILLIYFKNISAHPKTSGDNHLTHHETRYNWNCVGEMGLGMARLLRAHDSRVVTVAEGRRYDSSDGNPTREI